MNEIVNAVPWKDMLIIVTKFRIYSLSEVNGSLTVHVLYEV